DAYFGNRQNSAADFRIYGGPSDIFYLDIIRVSDVQPLWFPVAVIDAVPTSGQPPLEVNFDASNSSDPDGTIVGYEWDFDNDGTVDSTAVTDSYTYLTEDDYIARLTVTDDNGLTGTTSVMISVAIVTVPSDLDRDGDVDHEDFGLFQICLSGDGTLYGEGCEIADLDSDLDVDENDFAILEGCMNGANKSPGC
ncbi:MAG: PKD domain-containing protein, partial [Planctomycetota bacterium]